jgi:hypothetical protein
LPGTGNLTGTLLQLLSKPSNSAQNLQKLASEQGLTGNLWKSTDVRVTSDFGDASALQPEINREFSRDFARDSTTAYSQPPSPSRGQKMQPEAVRQHLTID